MLDIRLLSEAFRGEILHVLVETFFILRCFAKQASLPPFFLLNYIAYTYELKGSLSSILFNFTTINIIIAFSRKYETACDKCKTTL